MNSFLKVLFIGDIIGRAGRIALKRHLPKLKAENGYDIIIANGENSASGFGITGNVYKELLSLGVDIVTGGNHTWDKPDTIKEIHKWDSFVRSLNEPKGTPGNGYVTMDIDGRDVVVMSLLGRVFMGLADDPFAVFDKAYESLSDTFIIVDFHAEATAEKNAFASYVDGRAAVVAGTHTHVQTNDARVLQNGTLYITDVGMCGALDSCIGMEKKASIERFTTCAHGKLSVELKGRLVFNAFDFEINEHGKISSHNTINIYDDEV